MILIDNELECLTDIDTKMTLLIDIMNIQKIFKICETLDVISQKNKRIE